MVARHLDSTKLDLNVEPKDHLLSNMPITQLNARFVHTLQHSGEGSAILGPKHSQSQLYESARVPTALPKAILDCETYGNETRIVLEEFEDTISDDAENIKIGQVLCNIASCCRCEDCKQK